jgi:hypothetical protein
MKPNNSDPVIDEIREIRHRMSAQFDHDPKRLVAYLMELQEQHQDCLLRAAKARCIADDKGALAKCPD